MSDLGRPYITVDDLEDSMVHQAIKEAKEKIIGLKQTLRAIQQDKDQYSIYCE